MERFEYSIVDKEGKVVTGLVEAKTRDGAAKSLLDQNLTPVKISQKKEQGIFSKLNSVGKIPLTEMVLFTEELATLVNAGIPLTQSLNILEKQASNTKLKKTIENLSKEINEGISLSSAMEKNPQAFDKLYVNMVRSGEIGGTLDKELLTLAEQLNKDHELRAKVKGAMVYPAVIMVGMTAAMIYMILTIIPQLQDMFNDLGGELPVTTKSLIFISDMLTKYGLITLVVVLAIAYCFKYATNNIIGFKKFLHKILLKLPVVGKLTEKVNITQFSRTLGSLLSSGVNITEALEIVADSTGNMLFKEAIEDVAKKVKNGINVGDALKQHAIFPILVTQMISVGEETGQLDVILTKVSGFYEREVDNTTKNLSVLLEPMIMMLIGAMVGYLIIAIITPIYSMTNMF
jgi:type IV pilus assembly protein PilC